jgi:hypothetical protein
VRAARGEFLVETIAECKKYSKYKHVKSAWLREVVNGKLGDVIITFVKGKETNAANQ